METYSFLFFFHFFSSPIPFVSIQCIAYRSKEKLKPSGFEDRIHGNWTSLGSSNTCKVSRNFSRQLQWLMVLYTLLILQISSHKVMQLVRIKKGP